MQAAWKMVLCLATFAICAICAICVLVAPAVMAAEASPDAEEIGMADGVVLTESADTCSATVTCWDGSIVSCTGTSPCSYQSSSCPSSRGWVSCGYARKYCPQCLDACTAMWDECDTASDCLRPGEDCAACACLTVLPDPYNPEIRRVCICP